MFYKENLKNALGGVLNKKIMFHHLLFDRSVISNYTENTNGSQNIERQTMETNRTLITR
jgi:hypothetical protein